jgi:isopenicillin N synthase-like dioxygenase
MDTLANRVTTIPVIDLGSAWINGYAAKRDVAEKISQACCDIGFFYLVNHGVDAALTSEIFLQTRALFDLPESEKKKLDIQKSPYMRGYFSFGGDKSDGIHDDIKEGFDLALDLPAGDPLVLAKLPFYGPNTWPPLPGFQTTINAYYDAMMGVGIKLLRLFGLGLGVDEEFFPNRFKKPIAQIRLLKYPPPEDLTAVRIGAGEHTDFGWITMILQDEVGGLEVLDRGGTWTEVPHIPGSFVVNVGDLMQRWTNDKYVATMHRVMNRTTHHRYSAAFFMDPDYHVEVNCLPTSTDDGNPAKYTPIIVGDYMNQRFLDTTTFRDLPQP